MLLFRTMLPFLLSLFWVFDGSIGQYTTPNFPSQYVTANAEGVYQPPRALSSSYEEGTLLGRRPDLLSRHPNPAACAFIRHRIKKAKLLEVIDEW